MAGEWVTVKKKRGSDRGGGERSTYPEGSHPEPSDSGRWREQGKSPRPRGECGVGASRGPARVLLLVGLPGSGKSTFAKKLRAKGWWVISQDALGTRDRCVTEFRKALQRGKSVVVDRCNHTRAQRQIWIAESVRATAGSTTGARVFALCFNTDARECRRRVLERRGHRTLSPQDEEANGVVARFLAESEEVRNKEGFIKIYRRYHPTGKKNRKDEGAKDEDFLLRTIEAETSKPATKIRGLNASASPYLPSKRGSRPEAESGAAQQTAEDPPAAPYSIDCSNRVLLLFDLNGTLINKTNRRKNNLKSLKVRPGAEALLRLRDKGFKLGIYSSATLKTCTKAIKSLADAMGGEEVFSHVLHRDYCELAPGVAGKPWDTVKPLAKHVTDVNRCILFDDDEYKVLDSESLHHVLVPEWTGDRKDGVLGALVASTEARILSSEEEDVRMAAAKISLDLLEHEERAKGGKEGSERDSPRTSAATDLGNLSLSSP